MTPRVYLDMRRWTAAMLFALAAPPLSVAHEPPLPDAGAVLLEVRERLEAEADRHRPYAYLETRREQHLDGDGRLKRESVEVYEVRPGLPGEDGWERLIAEDGKPLPAERLAEQDRERRQLVDDYLRRFARDPAAACAEARRERDQDRRDWLETIDDVFRIYEMRLIGRETLGGYPTLVFTLSPRPGAEPRSRYGRLMKKLAGRAWISEPDRELVRLDVEAVDTISIGWGLIARVHEGARATFERRKIAGGDWVPARLAYSASARVGLVKMMRRSQSSVYSNYRRVTEPPPVSCADSRS